MNARQILDDHPGAWVTFFSLGREFRARMDPMWLGVENLSRLLENPCIALQLFDTRSQMRVMAADPTGKKFSTILRDYADAAGIGFPGLFKIIQTLAHVELLEIDLLRLGLEIKEWLRPEGELSTRRVWLLIEDFEKRPETRLGARHSRIEPMGKEGIIAAHIFAQNTGEKSITHPFLESPEDIAAAQEQALVDAEIRGRIKNQKPAEIQDGGVASPDDFASAREDSLAALAALEKGM